MRYDSPAFHRPTDEFAKKLHGFVEAERERECLQVEQAVIEHVYTYGVYPEVQYCPTTGRWRVVTRE